MNIQELFDFIATNKDLKEFKKFLERIFKDIEAELKKTNPNGSDADINARVDEFVLNFLNQTNSDGDTLLHVAARRSSFEIVQELIGLGLDIAAKNKHGKTALQLIEKSKNHEARRKAALLKTRSNWVRIAEGFNVNRVIHMLGVARPRIEAARGKPRILFVGPSGSGKSTFMNERAGVDYERVYADDFEPRAEQQDTGAKPVVEVGHGSSSMTIFPYACQFSDKKFAHVDLAGLFDTRGHEHQIVAASTTQWVANMPGNEEGEIQGILVFIDLPTILAGRSDGVREVAIALDKICNGNDEQWKSVRYVITKLMPEHRKATVKGFERKFNEIKSTTKDPRILGMLNDMVNNPDKIFLNDLSHDAGDKIDKSFEKLKPRKSSEYNFMFHELAQRNFRDFVIDISTKYLETKNVINQIPKTIEKNENEIKQHEKNIKALKQEIADAKSKLSRPFSPDEKDAALKSVRQKIQANKNKLDAKKAEADRLEKEIKKKQQEIDSFHDGKRHKVGTAHEHGFAKGTRPKIQMSWAFGAPVKRMESSYRYWGGNHGSDLIYPQLTGRKEVDPYDGKVIEIVEDKEGFGRYERTYWADEGISEYTVDFQAETQHLPQNRQVISNLRQELQNLQGSLALERRDISHLSTEKTRLADEEESLIVTAKKNYTEQMQGIIEGKEKAKANLENKIKSRRQENEDLKEQKASLLLELSVNRKLFEDIKDIIRDLKINEVNTTKFSDELEKDLSNPEFTDPVIGKDKEKADDSEASEPNDQVLFRKSPSGLSFREHLNAGQGFFEPEEEDEHWYDNEEMEVLLNHVFHNANDVDVIAAIDAHDLNGQMLGEIIQGWLREPGNQRFNHIILPVNLGNLHWTALYINVTDRQSPNIAAFVDPFGHQMPAEIRNAIKQAFPKIKDPNIFTSPIRLQKDGFNCGPWVVEILKYLVFKGALPEEGFNIREARRQHQAVMRQANIPGARM